MSQALLIVDLQNDFLPGGALAVPDGDEVITPINELAADTRFALRIATRDWHPADHSSFVQQGGPWPAHCVHDTFGAQLDDRLVLDRIDVILDKGIEPEASGYSAFERPELTDLLASRGIDAVTIVGLATDFCVVQTAESALAAGLEVTISQAAIRGIDAERSARALDALRSAGAHVV
jgi:nicotinamidase/pyrazinamidase